MDGPLGETIQRLPINANCSSKKTLSDLFRPPKENVEFLQSCLVKKAQTV